MRSTLTLTLSFMLFFSSLNLPLFYICFGLAFLIVCLKSGKNFFRFLIQDPISRVLFSLNLAFYVLPLNFSSEATRIFLKYAYLSILPSFLCYLHAKGFIKSFTTLWLGAYLASLIYILETLFPIVPKLSFGEVTAAGQLGMILLTHSLVFDVAKSGRTQMLLLLATLATLLIISSVPVLKPVGFLGFFALTFLAINNLVLKSPANLAGICLLFGGLIFLGKRAPLIGLLASLTYIFTHTKKRFLAILLLSGLALVLTNHAILVRFFEGISNDLRLVMWKSAFDVIFNQPSGLGYGGSSVIRELGNPALINFKHFHNTFLTILIENGVINFIGFISVVIFSFVRIRDAALKSLLIYFLTVGFFESNIKDSEVLVTFLILVSLLRIKGVGSEQTNERI